MLGSLRRRLLPPRGDDAGTAHARSFRVPLRGLPHGACHRCARRTAMLGSLRRLLLPPRVDQTDAAKHDDTQSLWAMLAFCRTTQ